MKQLPDLPHIPYYPVYIVHVQRTFCTLLQEFAVTLVSHYSHRYATSLVGGHLPTPLYDRHAPRTTCVCQFIEREFFQFSRDSINTVS